jgi:hypothetical protein
LSPFGCNCTCSLENIGWWSQSPLPYPPVGGDGTAIYFPANLATYPASDLWCHPLFTCVEACSIMLLKRSRKSVKKRSKKCQPAIFKFFKKVETALRIENKAKKPAQNRLKFFFVKNRVWKIRKMCPILKIFFGLKRLLKWSKLGGQPTEKSIIYAGFPQKGAGKGGTKSSVSLFSKGRKW